MNPGGGDAGSARSFAAIVAIALVRHDVPDATGVEIEAAADYVDECLAAMPDVTRVGVTVASAAAYVVLSVLGGAPYGRQPAERRATNAARMAAVRLPVLAEFGRLTRGLGLVGAFEQRARRGGAG